jgi:hypothetical protein
VNRVTDLGAPSRAAFIPHWCKDNFGELCLETVAAEEAAFRERYWVTYWRTQGLRLVNHPPGRGMVRWTVYVPQAMKEELQRRAAARGENPNLLVQEALARWLAEEV